MQKETIINYLINHKQEFQRKYEIEKIGLDSFPSVLDGNVYERTPISSMHYDGDRRNEGKT